MQSDNPRDWVEDFEHDNGMYWCRCSVCTEQFTGHKRRVVCKVCHLEANSPESLKARIDQLQLEVNLARNALAGQERQINFNRRQITELQESESKLRRVNAQMFTILEQSGILSEAALNELRNAVTENTFDEIAAKANIGDVVFKFIDRMQDVCEQSDPAERIVAEFVAAVDKPLKETLEGIRAAFDERKRPRPEPSKKPKELAGYLQKEVLDKIVASGEAHLSQILNDLRTGKL